MAGGDHTEEIGLLPWERGNHSPVAVGVCISGGGLRAASYHLGAMQELQEQRGLMFGPASADILAAVSGGAYIAAAQTLAASKAELGAAPPFARDSPEDVHVSANARYLVADGAVRTILRFGAPIVLTMTATLVLLVWSGVMLAMFAFVADMMYEPPTGDWSWWPWVLAVIGLIAARLTVAWMWTDEPLRRGFGVLVGFVGVISLSSFVIGGLSRVELLSEWSAWKLGWGWLWVVAAVALLAALPMLLAKLGPARIEGRVACRSPLRLWQPGSRSWRDWSWRRSWRSTRTGHSTWTNSMSSVPPRPG